MNCHFLIPGLLWPAESLREVSRDLELPALATLLGRGRLDWQPTVGCERWLAQRFGLQGDELPFGALRLAGESHHAVDAADAAWLCADPVHLRFARDMLILADSRELQIAPDEAVQLVAALNAEFADIGEFRAATTDRWYLKLRDPTSVRTHPPSQVIGRRIDAFLPEGDDGAQWRRHFNESQVLLHAHQVNRAREEANRPLINSLWFWGAGALPTSVHAPFGAVHDDAPLAHGLAAAANIAHDALGSGFDAARFAASGVAALIVLDMVEHAAHYLDTDAWRSGLRDIEQRWLAPALAALKAGKIDRITISALGDAAQLDITMTRNDLWKFWRRPCGLTDIAFPRSAA